MLSFNQYVTEKTVIGGFNIPRASMPQIADQESFARYLEFIGVDVRFVKSHLNFLKPTQTEFDQEKVDSMQAPYGSIIVSNDGYILDGHHRFFAAVADPDHDSIDTYTCGVTINQLLAHAKDYLDE